jgi:hypothetical protein
MRRSAALLLAVELDFLATLLVGRPYSAVASELNSSTADDGLLVAALAAASWELPLSALSRGLDRPAPFSRSRAVAATVARAPPRPLSV